jgi:hypothetical protein
LRGSRIEEVMDLDSSLLHVASGKRMRVERGVQPD